MSYVGTYKSLLLGMGNNAHMREVKTVQRDLVRLAPLSAAYQTISIDGVERNVIISSTDNFMAKQIISIPPQYLSLGQIVTFKNRKWITTERDFDDEVYSKSIIKMCNSVLKWKSGNTTYTYYGYADDATKYSEGISKTERIKIGEFQLKVIVKLDAVSALINRDMRFLIDCDKYITNIVANGDTPYAFKVTRRNIVTGTYDDEGYVEITLVEDAFIHGKDDAVNMIAAQPSELKGTASTEVGSTVESGWL